MVNARLEITGGFHAGETFPIEGESQIGRSLNNAICLPDSRASRTHARILVQGTSYFLEDVGSANGTSLRGQLIPPQQPVEMHDGDELQICTTRLVFLLGESPSPPRQAEQIATAPGPRPAPSPGKLPPRLAAALGRVAEADDDGTRSGVRDLGGLELDISKDDGKEPSVNLALDASMSRGAVDEQEAKSEIGLQAALKRLEAMCLVSETLGNVVDQAELMPRLVDMLFDIFPAAERALIMLRQDDGQIEPVFGRSRDEVVGQQETVPFSRSIINSVVEKREAAISSDAASDYDTSQSIAQLSIRAMMCAPLLVRDEILGAIQVDSMKGFQAFAQQDLKVIVGLAAQAAVAIKNAQLYEDVERETGQRLSLQRYFSPNMVEMMMAGDIDTELGGKSYTGTVFFSDIIGFTPLSESMPAADVVACLNRYFTVMQKLIYGNGGNVDKFQGDAIMAFWSVPHHVDGDERRSVLTGVQMQGDLWPFNLSMESDGLLPIHMGIGLNTGEFIAGNVGSEDKIEFTLIGDQVNHASRIESKAGRGQVFIAESTHAPIARDVCAIKLPPILLKGEHEESSIYAIRAIREEADQWALNLPCVVLGVEGQMAKGMLTCMVIEGEQRRFQLSTTTTLVEGMKISIQLDVQELRAELLLSGVIVKPSTVDVREDLSYSYAWLTEPRGDAALQLLTPGVCLATDLTWDEMKRE